MIYKGMLEQYGMGPNEVNELTLFQLAVYMGGITTEHGQVSLSLEETIGMIGRQKAKAMGLI